MDAPATLGTVLVRAFDDDADDDAVAVARLATAVQWPSLSDPEVVQRVSTAPGAAAYVAECGGDVVGWAQALGDGVLQSHLSFLAVHPGFRGRGIGRLLVVATFQETRTLRMDLVADAAHDVEGFYERFEHRRLAGYRIWPGA